jgi:hypothetical protein
MRHLMSLLLVALTFSGWAAVAIADQQTTIQVNGVDWLQPIDFSQFSWNEVEAACDFRAEGLCSGLLGEIDITGWTWASAEDVSALFNFFIGSQQLTAETTGNTRYFFSRDQQWATAFFDAGFQPQYQVGQDRYLAAFVRNPVSLPENPQFRLFGKISEYYRPYCSTACDRAEIDESWDFHDQNGPPAWGYWFFRAAQGTAR